ncbi:MAG: endopeptidase La [Acidobacteria bacterium]|nr:endopeptidase La [Acidobacteriota bacterium]
MVDINLEKNPEEDGSHTTQVMDDLPILPLRNVVVYPHMVVPITVGQPRSLRLVDSAAIGERMLGLVTMKDPNIDEPGPDLLYEIGTWARIIKLIKAPDGTVRMIVQGVERIKVQKWTAEEPFLRARVETMPDHMPASDDNQAEAMRRHVLELFGRLAASSSRIPTEVANAAIQSEDLRHFVYLVASSVQLELNQAQDLLEIDDVKEKLSQLQQIMSREIEVLELGKKIQSDARSEIDKTQREYLLREQLKAIKRELGESDEQQVKLDEYRSKIDQLGMTEEAKREALRELGRLEKLPEAAAEYGVIQTYLDWLTSLPWSNKTKDTLDLAHAKQVLDEDHFDLEKIKERLLEFLAVRKLKSERGNTSQSEDHIRKQREGVILCLVGPPGVGKTSLGQSIARALGRKFIRISLGGVRDEAEIRGHRRTYIGAMPGRFIQTIRRAETKNPIIMLDEVDKLSHDWRGDPSSALLEVLDPEQNREFRDHYLDVAFDLSEVMFIATANVAETIPQPLLDRMEVIQLSGYTDYEKLHIAKGYLIPRQVSENGLRTEEVTFDDEALNRMINDYTREAGVRSLERQIGAVCRKVAVRIAKDEISQAQVTESDVTEYLGKPRFFAEVAERTATPGVATGLAYTPAGGDILFIEATRMAGKKGLTITGQLGDVMKESAQTALSYVRAKADQWGIDADFFESSDIHIHVPAGAVPKDGPSAGVTIATALTSLLTGRPVRTDVGMTGEITLRGKVMPVGGIKEKILAAHRAGLRTILLPQRNEKDLEDLLPEVRDAMTFILVQHIDEVIEAALEKTQSASIASSTVS